MKELNHHSIFIKSGVQAFISVFLVIALLYFMIPLLDWAFIKATWVGVSKQDCNPGGACWAMVHTRLNQFIYGLYPLAEQWRVNTAMILLGLLLIIMASWRLQLRYRIFSAFFITAMVIYILHGGILLTTVSTDRWGGLFLTIILAVGSIVCAFPIGIILAMGRRSSLTIIKSFCVFYIEVIRGVPLITILFMSSVMVPMFFSAGVDIDKLLRAFIGITLFQAAYLAEVIRGGLNNLPKGQYEAAYTLGLGYFYTMWFIILPQALRIVIPGLVNSFIALFKDTTLVLMIGIFDFLGMVQAATTDPRWLGTSLEGYLFCALVYWVFCFSMSYYSQYLEKHLTLKIN